MKQTTSITIDSKNIRSNIRKYYEQLYTHKFHKIQQMLQFLTSYKLTKLTHE